MKYLIQTSILFILLFSGCNSSSHIINDDFLQDLSSENNRVWGELYLDRFSGNFSSLTLEYYISYLDSTKKTSASDIIEKLLAADRKLLSSNDSTFWLLLYYDGDDTILADNAFTDIGTVDTSIGYTNNAVPPDLIYFAEKLLNKNQ